MPPGTPVGALFLHIPRDNQVVGLKTPFLEARANYSAFGRSISQCKLIPQHLVHISISGRVWGKKAFILIRYSSSCCKKQVPRLKHTHTHMRTCTPWYVCKLMSLNLIPLGRQPVWSVLVNPSPPFLSFFSFWQCWSKGLFRKLRPSYQSLQIPSSGALGRSNFRHSHNYAFLWVGAHFTIYDFDRDREV